MLTGLSFAHPAGAWAFLAVAAVAALYLFYRRHRPRAATGLFLWGLPERRREGGRKRERPFAGRAFWFDMLAAALLAAALAEPVWSSRERTRVVVLDNALGMQARGNHLDAMRIAADAAAGARQAAVVLAGAKPLIGRALGRAGGEALPAWLEKEYFPVEETGDLAGAVAFARDVYGGGAEVHLITNQAGADSLAGAGGTVHALAGRGGNLAFSHIWRLDAAGAEPGRAGGGGAGETLFLGIVNYGGATEAAVSVAAGEDAAEIASRRVPLAAGETARLAIPLAAAWKGDALRVRVAAADGAAGSDCIAFDSAAAVPPAGPGRPTAAVRDLPAAPRRLLETALRAAGCVLLEDAAAAELLVTGSETEKGRVATLRLCAEDNPASALPPYRLDHASPLCRDVDLSGVTWAVAARAAAARAEEVFIAAGDVPLFWREGEDGFALNALPERGNLATSPAWPVLIANVAARAEALRGGAPPALPLYGAASDTRALAGRAAVVRGAERPERGAEGRLDLRWALVLCAAVFLGCNFLPGARRGEGGGS